MEASPSGSASPAVSAPAADSDCGCVLEARRVYSVLKRKIASVDKLVRKNMDLKLQVEDLTADKGRIEEEAGRLKQTIDQMNKRISELKAAAASVPPPPPPLPSRPPQTTRFVQTVSATRQNMATQTEREEEEEIQNADPSEEEKMQDVPKVETVEEETVTGMETDDKKGEDSGDEILATPVKRKRRLSSSSSSSSMSISSSGSSSVASSAETLAAAASKASTVVEQKKSVSEYPAASKTTPKVAFSFFRRRAPPRPRRAVVVRFDTRYAAFCTDQLPNKAATIATAGFLPVATVAAGDKMSSAHEEFDSWRSSRRESAAAMALDEQRRIKVSEASAAKRAKKKGKRKTSAVSVDASSASASSPEKQLKPTKAARSEESAGRSPAKKRRTAAPNKKAAGSDGEGSESVAESPKPASESSRPVTETEPSRISRTPKAPSLPEMFALGRKHICERRGVKTAKTCDVQAVKKSLLEKKKEAAAIATPPPQLPKKSAKLFGRLPESLLVADDTAPVAAERRRKRETAIAKVNSPKKQPVETASVPASVASSLPDTLIEASLKSPAHELPERLRTPPQSSAPDVSVEVSSKSPAKEPPPPPPATERVRELPPMTEKPLQSSSKLPERVQAPHSPPAGIPTAKTPPPPEIPAAVTDKMQSAPEVPVEHSSKSPQKAPTQPVIPAAATEIVVRPSSPMPELPAEPFSKSAESVQTQPVIPDTAEKEQKSLQAGPPQTGTSTPTVMTPSTPLPLDVASASASSRLPQSLSAEEGEQRSLLESLFARFADQKDAKTTVIKDRMAKAAQEREAGSDYSREMIRNTAKIQLGRLFKKCNAATFGNIVKHLSKPEYSNEAGRKLLASLIFEETRKEPAREADSAQHQQPNLPRGLTPKQMKVVSLLDALEDAGVMRGFRRYVVKYLYYVLFGVGRIHNMAQFESVNLVRLYLTLLRAEGLEMAAKQFLYDMLFFKNSRNHVFICLLVEVWPMLLMWPPFAKPIDGQTSLEPLLETMIWVVNSTGPASNLQDLRVYEARSLLARACHLKYVQQTSNQLLKKLIAGVKETAAADEGGGKEAGDLRSATSMALLLLSRTQEHRWAHNNVIRMLLDMLGETDVFKSGNRILCWVVETIGLVSRAFPSDGRDLLVVIFEPIVDILEAGDPGRLDAATEATCALALIRIGHHLQAQVAKFLSRWRPRHPPLDPEVERVVANFLGTRGNNHARITISVERKKRLKMAIENAVEDYSVVERGIK